MSIPNISLNKSSIELQNFVNNPPKNLKTKHLSNFFKKAHELRKHASWEQIFNSKTTTNSSTTPEMLNSLSIIANCALKKPHISKKYLTLVQELNKFINEKVNRPNNIPTPTPPIESLPAEILFKIFESTENSNYPNFHLVNHRWHATVTKIQTLSMLNKMIVKSAGDQFKFIKEDLGLLEKLIKSWATEIPDNIYFFVDYFLKNARRFSVSTQNNLIEHFLSLVKNYLPVENFIEIASYVYTSPWLSQGNRLHIIWSSNKENSPLYSALTKINIPTSPFPNSPKGIFLPSDSSFDLTMVPNELLPNLIISDQNTFEKGEIVAIDHTGDLVGMRSRPFYAFISDVFHNPSEQPSYVIHLQRSITSKEPTFWDYNGKAKAMMLGKIPDSYSTRQLLSNEFTINQ